MVMDSEETYRPDEGVVTDGRGAAAAASYIEEKDDESDQPVRENNPANVAEASAASAAKDSDHVVSAQDGSDGMMDIGAETRNQPDGEAAPNEHGAGAAAATAGIVEAKDDEQGDQTLHQHHPERGAAAVAAAVGDSNHVAPAQDGGNGMMDIGLQVGDQPGGGAVAPNEQAAGVVAAADERDGEHIASLTNDPEPLDESVDRAVVHQRRAPKRKAAESGLDVDEGDDSKEAEDEDEERKSQDGGGVTADRGGEHIISLSNDPDLMEDNMRHSAVPKRRVAPKRKVRESRLAPDEGDDSKEAEKAAQQDDEEERKGQDGDGAAEHKQPAHEWIRFLSISKKSIRVLWANGDVTDEPRAEFERQIDPLHFAYHASLAKMPPKQQGDMLALLAKSRSKAAPSEHKPRATRSGRLFSGLTPPVKKSKKMYSGAEQMSDEDGVDHGQTVPACVDISQATCSYCGCVGILCFRCTAVASCTQRVCMHCWTLAASSASVKKIDELPENVSSCVGTFVIFNEFHCQQHGGSVHLPIHPMVQLYGLPSNQLQTIGVWTSKVSFSTYHSQLNTSPLSPVLLSAAGQLSSGQQAAAVLLEYHSDVDHGHASFDEPTVGRSFEPDIRQVAMLARFVDPATTKLVVMMTCDPYRKQLSGICAASRELYPHTTFLLFDIAQLFVKDILPAVCGTVRQYLLYPSASPLHLAAENFGKKLLQTYRPSFLFRGQLLPVVHHCQDALVKCACGVTLKSHGLAHKAAGWEAFERFQVYRYKCKKVPSCGATMLVPRV
jgi:hypothetical protein